MYKETLRYAWVEINLDNLDFNIKQIKNKIGPDVDLIGVIKADGYGHGSVKTAEILQKNGISTFAVATVAEAVELRDSGFNEEIHGFSKGAMFGPMIGTIPFIGYIFEVDANTDVAEFVNTLKTNANLRWNICTEADEMAVEAVGNLVFFVMAPAEFTE